VARPESDSLLAALQAAFAGDLLRTARDELAPHETDHRRLYQGRALALALPRRTDEVSRLLAWCNAHGVGVVPQGGNTSYCGGATPDASGTQLVLNLRRMDRVRSVDPANLALTVEAGCLLANVQAAAADAGCCFPLELGSAGSCQIGGNLATNAGGLNVLRYGMARELVLGIEAVLPDGRVYSRLRVLRKDNTGYDLKSLLVGSEGTLAVITACTLRLWPARRHAATAFVAVPGLDEAVQLLALLRSHAGERIESFEVLPRVALELVARHVPGTAAPPDNGSPWQVLCELASAGDEPLEDVLQQALAQALEAGLVRDAVIAVNEAQRLAFWRLRESVPEAQRRAGPGLKHDVSVPVAAVPRFVARAAAWLGAEVPRATLVAYGHLGDGNLHFNLNWLDGAAEGEIAAAEPRIKRHVHDLVAAMGGSFSAEHGIGQLKAAELARYASPVELAVMRELKHALDPKGIMNPGKVLEPAGHAARDSLRA
jgi:FAD/FMN-containing dehydrogenase